jgi:hypothetical protein
MNGWMDEHIFDGALNGKSSFLLLKGVVAAVVEDLVINKTLGALLCRSKPKASTWRK